MTYEEEFEWELLVKVSDSGDATDKAILAADAELKRLLRRLGEVPARTYTKRNIRRLGE
jgi:hypothetical protein